MATREGKTVFMANSEDEAEEYFWKEIKSAWTQLREPVELKEGIKLGDVYNMVQSRPELRLLASMWWPNYRNVTPIEEPDSDRLIVSRQGIIDRSDRLLVVNELETEPALALSEMPLEVNDSFIVKKKVVLKKKPDITTKQILEGKYPFSLLDLLCGLFHNYVFYGPVTLTKSGLLDEDGEPVDDPLPYLLSDCKIKKLTLGDLFSWVENNKGLKDFISMYSWCNDIDEFHAASRNKPTKTDLDYLECYKVIGNWSNHAELCTGFHGVGPPITEGIKNSCYGVEFCDMSELAQLPLRVDDSIQIETKEGVIECHHPFTLIEILDSVYWEISYFGTVEQIKALTKHRTEVIQDIMSQEP